MEMKNENVVNDNNPKIMTVLGPIQGEDIGWVLMNEHLVCDEAVAKRKQQQQGTSSSSSSITLENLHTIRRHPWPHGFNTMPSNSSTIDEELKPLLQQISKTATNPRDNNKKVVAATILDVTSVDEGRNHKAVQTLAKRLGSNTTVQIIMGTTCEASSTTDDPKDKDKYLKKQIARMEQELLYGIDFDFDKDATGSTDIVRAGFIGQLALSSPVPTQHEWQQLKACAMVQGSTKAPLIVGVPEPSSPPSRQIILEIIQTLETFNGGNLQSRTVLSHMDLYHKDVELIETVLDKGHCIGLDRYSLAYSVLNLDSIYPTIHNVITMLQTLLAKNPAYVHQIVLSAGIEMKLQYQKYGGPGYAIVWDLIERLIQTNTLTRAQLDTVLTENPRKLLQWWTPPPEPTKPIEYLECSVCKKMFEPILGQYYTKYAFTYCGRECLTKHRLAKFKPID